MNDKKIRSCKLGCYLLLIFTGLELLLCFVGADWTGEILRDWRLSNVLTYVGLTCTVVLLILLIQRKRNASLCYVFATLTIVKGVSLYSCITERYAFYGNFSSYYGWDDGASGINLALALPDILAVVSLIISACMIILVLTRSANIGKTIWIPSTLIYIGAALRIVGAFSVYTPYFSEIQLLLQGIGMILLGIALHAIVRWMNFPFGAPVKTWQSDKVGYVRLMKHILLLLFTFGIWQLIWTYRTTMFLNCLTKEKQRNPVAALLLCMFVPFYNIYWTYQTARRTDCLAAENGIYSEIAAPCLLCSFFVALAAPILIQEKINTCVHVSS